VEKNCIRPASKQNLGKFIFKNLVVFPKKTHYSEGYGRMTGAILNTGQNKTSNLFLDEISFKHVFTQKECLFPQTILRFI
jgi:hypothetical protein